MHSNRLSLYLRVTRRHTSSHTQWLELFDYIVNQKASEKEYANGARDKGRNGMRLVNFQECKRAQKALLKAAEVSVLQ